MRALVYAIILFIAICGSIQPVLAFTDMTIPFVTTCDAVFMQPTIHADATIVEFNDARIAKNSLETLNIDFPAFADGVHLGPSVFNDGTITAPGTTATGITSANVLPFGPVNLAFPSIRQTADETCSYQRTYFFVDTGIL